MREKADRKAKAQQKGKGTEGDTTAKSQTKGHASKPSRKGQGDKGYASKGEYQEARGKGNKGPYAFMDTWNRR